MLAAAAAGKPAQPDIGALLDAAEAAEREGRIIYPASGSAVSTYHEVLSWEPANADARNALIRIAESYLEEAQTAIDADRLLKADSLVSKARSVYPGYPEVVRLAEQIEQLENAERERVTLNWRHVAERSDELKPTLARLGGSAKAGDCRVTIDAGNDAEGRWLYRQMNQVDGPGRLRARIRVRSPSAVEVVCF